MIIPQTRRMMNFFSYLPLNNYMSLKGVAYRVDSIVPCSWLHYSISAQVYSEGIMHKYICTDMGIFYIYADIKMWYNHFDKLQEVCRWGRAKRRNER